MDVGGLRFLDKIPVKRVDPALGVRVVPPGCRTVRRVPRRGRRADARLRQHRRLGRPADDGRHVGDGRLLRPDRRRRPPRRRRRHRRGARAAAGRPGDRRGRCLRRVSSGDRRGRPRRRGRRDRARTSSSRRACRSSTSPARSPSSTAAWFRRARSCSRACGRRSIPAGTFGLQCALIVGERSASTDLKTSLNDVLREFEIAV